MRCAIILHLILLSIFSFAQTDINYSGALILNDNTPISFKLELIEQKGLVSGFSVTNIDTKDETQSEITGLYFKTDKSFQLQETQILKKECFELTFPNHKQFYISYQNNFKNTVDNFDLYSRPPPQFI